MEGAAERPANAGGGDMLRHKRPKQTSARYRRSLTGCRSAGVPAPPRNWTDRSHTSTLLLDLAPPGFFSSRLTSACSGSNSLCLCDGLTCGNLGSPFVGDMSFEARTTDSLVRTHISIDIAMPTRIGLVSALRSPHKVTCRRSRFRALEKPLRVLLVGLVCLLHHLLAANPADHPTRPPAQRLYATRGSSCPCPQRP